ncbi:helix-turn-helix domain-containing protein [Paludibacterium yongneupense]|uniref:helix-turn-helix domain-containing protein n=1 Tax=Paludibacterium yongneupense TaxID=400061 RepID=UPI0004155B93|nr:helix-turn-helix domain-containing protein [Paludibacterium yongneupense]
MTLLEHREQLTDWVQQACNDGASLYRSCAVVGISVHSWYRWRQDGVVSPDQRPLVDRPEPANKLCAAERQAVLALCNSPRFDSVPPSQIVPILADEGRYVASESTMYRVLRAAAMLHQPRPPGVRVVVVSSD